MTVFESISKTSTKATEIGEKYVDTSRDYIKLKVFQQVTITLSLLAKMVIIGSLVFLGLIFFAISGAIVIGNYFGSVALGCLVIGLIYCLIGFIFYLFRSNIDSTIIKIMAKKF